MLPNPRSHFRSLRRRCRLPQLVLGLTTLASTGLLSWEARAQAPPAPSAQEATEPPLPLPQHPERKETSADKKLPKPAQPNRERQRSVPTRTVRTGSRMPMPGRPARDLPPIGEVDEEEAIESDSEDEETDEALTEEEASDPGLLLGLPHEFCDGAITGEYIYTGESFTLAKGGFSRQKTTNYRGNMDVVLTFDLEKLSGWSGARFFLYANNIHGRVLSANDVGDFQLFSNIDSTIGTNAQGELERPYYTAVGEYWLEQTLFDDLVRFKIGKQDSNADFAYTDVGGDFVNSGFAMPAMVPLPTWPSQALGVSAFFQLTDDAVFMAGVYDASPFSGPQGVRWGFDTLGHFGAMSLYQLEWTPATGPYGEHPRTVRLGAWHHSDDEAWSSFDADPVSFSQNYGMWASIDQMIWKEEYGTDSDQGLSVFYQFSWAPDNRNVVYETYMTGLVYKGLLEGRDDDLIGAGVTNVRFGQPYRDFTLADSGDEVGTRETVVETFYKILFSPYLSVQPDLQFIANPSGLYKDALVAGVRFELVL